jgi:hypothetical protein
MWKEGSHNARASLRPSYRNPPPDALASKLFDKLYPFYRNVSAAVHTRFTKTWATGCWEEAWGY